MTRDGEEVRLHLHLTDCTENRHTHASRHDLTYRGLFALLDDVSTIVNAIVANFAEGLEFNPAGTGPDPIVDSLALEGNTSDFSGSGATLFAAGSKNRSFAGHSLDGVLPGVNEAATSSKWALTRPLQICPPLEVQPVPPVSRRRKAPKPLRRCGTRRHIPSGFLNEEAPS